MQYPPILPPGQIPSEAFIRSWYSALTTIFAPRNGEYKVLRSIFDGSYSISPNTASQSLQDVRTGGVFADRVKLVYNVANATVRRYMDSMSAPPRIDGVPDGFDEESIELADKRSKFIEYIYECNDMTMKLIMSSYYQALLDKAIFNIRPAPHLPHKIKIEMAVPDFYFPISRGDDWQHPLAVIYGFRTFENSDMMRDPNTFNADPVFNTVIEYWDHDWFVRIEGGKAPLCIQHGLGFIPWYECHNLPIPHRYRGQGDIDQAVGLNEYLNTLMSSMADMIAYAANPIAVVRGTKVGGTNLPFEPRAVWELERDAQVGFLQWTGTPPTVEAQILRTIQAIEDTTGVSSPAFGREIPSGTSGQAVRSLLAGFNTRLGTKQQLMGECLTKMNSGILAMAEKMFPNEEFRLCGENVRKGSKRVGKKAYYSVQPKEFKGWYKTRTVFQPLDPASTYFQEVDKFTKGLQSKYTTLKMLGVQNVGDELERIRIEKEDEAEHQNNLGLAQQGKFARPTPDQTPDELVAQLRELAGSSAVPNVDNAKNLRDKTAREGTENAVKKQPEQSLVTGPSSPSQTPALQEPGLDVQSVLAKLKLSSTRGRAAVIGKNLDQANARGEIIVDDPQDVQAIKQALGPLASRFDFSKIDPVAPLPEGAIAFSDPKGLQKKKSSIHP